MSGRPSSGARRRTARAAAGVLAALALLLIAASCRPAPEDALPAGTLWAGDAAAARRVLNALEGLEQTPLALAASELDRRLAGCRRFVAFCPTGKPCNLAGSVTCEPGGTLAAQADTVRAGASWLFTRGDAERRLLAWGDVDGSGGVQVRARFHDDFDGKEPWQALLPARGAPARPVLSEGHVLAHLLLRSDRGFAGLGSSEGAAWAERLYGLSGELFTAMALEGTTELAVYDPAPGEQMPPLAVALHVPRRDAAVAALEKLIATTHEKWGATRETWEHAGHRGACLSNLDLLPGLAPCYLATDRALVLGWNRLSVAVALLNPPADAEPAASGLVVRFDRFPAADARLREAWRSGGAPPVRYPWSRLALRGSKERDGYAMELRLDGGAP